ITPAAADRLAGHDTTANLRAVLAAVRGFGWRVDFYVLSGDLTRDGEAEAYARLKGLLAEIDAFGVPVLLSLGNHDDRGAFRRIILGEAPGDPTRPYYYSRRIGDLRVVMLDSLVPGEAHGEID